MVRSYIITPVSNKRCLAVTERGTLSAVLCKSLCKGLIEVTVNAVGMKSAAVTSILDRIKKGGVKSKINYHRATQPEDICCFLTERKKKTPHLYPGDAEKKRQRLMCWANNE